MRCWLAGTELLDLGSSAVCCPHYFSACGHATQLRIPFDIRFPDKSRVNAPVTPPPSALATILTSRKFMNLLGNTTNRAVAFNLL